MKHCYLLLIVFFLFMSSLASYGQDEAYSNETRDNIFDSGGKYYGLSYGTDFENRHRATYQFMGILARNLAGGTTILYSQSKDELNNFGLGWTFRNYFLNGNTRPFIEAQLNLKGSQFRNETEETSFRFNAEWSGLGGLSYFIDISGGYINVDLIMQYYEPIFTDLNFESGFIPTLRIGYFY